MIKVKGSSRMRLAALAKSKKVLQRQLYSDTEIVYQTTERYRAPVPNQPAVVIADVLGDFSEQTGASFG